MGPFIFTAALLLAQAGAGDTPPSSDQAPAPTQGKTTSPPQAKTTPPPKPGIDPGIELPRGAAPEPPKVPSDPVTPNKDSIDPKDGSVKKVAPAPADPDKPAGVRPL